MRIIALVLLLWPLVVKGQNATDTTQADTLLKPPRFMLLAGTDLFALFAQNNNRVQSFYPEVDLWWFDQQRPFNKNYGIKLIFGYADFGFTESPHPDTANITHNSGQGLFIETAFVYPTYGFKGFNRKADGAIEESVNLYAGPFVSRYRESYMLTFPNHVFEPFQYAENRLTHLYGLHIGLDYEAIIMRKVSIGGGFSSYFKFVRYHFDSTPMIEDGLVRSYYYPGLGKRTSSRLGRQDSGIRLRLHFKIKYRIL